MIKTVGSLQSTKEKIKSYLGCEVEVKVNLGRNKYAKYVGKLTEFYPALFRVVPSCKYNGKTSFSYSECLCGLVKIKKI